MSAKQIAKLEAQAARALAQAKQLKEDMQKRCNHPLSQVGLTYTGTSSISPSGNQEHSMRATCSVCGYSEIRYLKIYNDCI